MDRRASIFQIVALALLIPAAALEVAGLGFWGLDLLVGLMLTASAALASASVLGGGSRFWGVLTATAAVIALVLHLWLNFGFLA